jgi:hypothetical protein
MKEEKIMKKTIFSILMTLALCFTLNAQDARQRTVETIVQDVLAALPAENLTDCYVQMADLAKSAPASVEMLGSMLQPAEAGANNIVEYAIVGVVRYATDPANAAVKENVKKGIEAAAAACKDKYNKQFLESQLRLMTPPATYADYDPIDVKAVSKTKTSNAKCQVLWALADNLGAKSAKKMIAALKDDDRAVRANALYASEAFADDAFYAQVAKAYKKLSDDAKVDVLTWFGDRKAASQFDLIASELIAPGARGAAAAEAIAMIGGEKAADALLATPVTKENAAALAKALNFVNVDLTDKVVKALPDAESLQRDFLVQLAGKKRIYEAAPFVLKLAENEVPVALEALAGVVTPADFTAVAKMVDSKPCDQLSKALNAAVKTLSADEKFATVKKVADAAANPERFYDVMALAGNADAINYLTEKYNAGSEKALAALSKINDLAVAPVLLGAADKNQSYLSRYVSIVNANEKNVDKKCENFVQALAKATDPKIQNTVLKALGNIPSMRAFTVVGEYLDKADNAYTAAAAAKSIASKNAAGIDYYALQDRLGKAIEVYQAAGGPDDGYAVDELKQILSTVKPYEKFQLSDEEKKLGYEILFDGTDLSKWVGDKVGYTAVNGCINVTASYGDSKNLYTEKEYTDFVFRFEFCFEKPGVNNGVGIRTPMGVDAAYHGMCEVQVLDHDAPVYAKLKAHQVHGSVYGIVPAKRIVHKPLGEWSTMEIRVVGDNVKVTVNGEVITDANVRKATKGHNVAPDGSNKNPYTVDGRNHPGLFNKKGHIGFLGHGAGLKYRNVRVLDLSAKK